MQQRVEVAIGLSCNPDLLLADEPTTALDVTIQAQVLEMIKKLMEERNRALILITHNLGIVADMCDLKAEFSGEELQAALNEIRAETPDIAESERIYLGANRCLDKRWESAWETFAAENDIEAFDEPFFDIIDMSAAGLLERQSWSTFRRARSTNGSTLSGAAPIRLPPTRAQW